LRALREYPDASEELQMDLNQLADRYEAVWNERNPKKTENDRWPSSGFRTMNTTPTLTQATGHEELEPRVLEFP